MQHRVRLRAKESELRTPNLAPRVVSSDFACSGMRRQELRGGDRPAGRPHGHLDRSSGFRIHEERGRLARLSPAHPIDEHRVVDVHGGSPEAQIPVVREAEHEEVRGAEDEVRGRDYVIPRTRPHTAPASSAAKGGRYDIMSSETWRIIATPPTSLEYRGMYDRTRGPRSRYRTFMYAVCSWYLFAKYSPAPSCRATSGRRTSFTMTPPIGIANFWTIPINRRTTAIGRASGNVTKKKAVRSGSTRTTFAFSNRSFIDMRSARSGSFRTSSMIFSFRNESWTRMLSASFRESIIRVNQRP